MDAITIRYCIHCKDGGRGITEHPCVVCLDTDPIGRERPLWTPKQEAGETLTTLPEPAQMSLF